MKEYTVSIMENNLKVGIVIMASGLGRRFGSNKLLEDLNGKPLIKWIIDATENLFDKRVVVTRSTSVKQICDSLKVECILHELPNRNDTVRLGLTALMSDVDYCFFTPADQPLISRQSIIRLVERVKASDCAKLGSEKIVRTSYGDIVGSPVGFPSVFFEKLLNLPEKKGGGWIAKNHPDMVDLVEVCHEYELWDVDTVADLEKIKNVINKD